jgi:endonuclease/exonuclease/phosphatase (EEP) superfamily protein YafD
LYQRLSRHFSDAFGARGYGCGNTFPAGFPIARIDYIWAGEEVRFLTSRVLAARGSDHRPLLAEIEILR